MNNTIRINCTTGHRNLSIDHSARNWSLCCCAFFKIDVEEFGIGFPPRAMRLWRRKSKFKLGDTEIIVPIGRRVLQDLEVGQWADITADTPRKRRHIPAEKHHHAGSNPQKIWHPSTKSNRMGWFICGVKSQHTNLNMFFSLNWLPFGGFVRIKGEGDTSIPDGIAAANPWVRIGVYFAGPLANLLIGIILYAYIISQAGMATQVFVAEVSPDFPCRRSGFAG